MGTSADQNFENYYDREPSEFSTALRFGQETDTCLHAERRTRVSRALKLRSDKQGPSPKTLHTLHLHYCDQFYSGHDLIAM